jgi:hypothetical protein
MNDAMALKASAPTTSNQSSLDQATTENQTALVILVI